MALIPSDLIDAEAQCNMIHTDPSLKKFSPGGMIVADGSNYRSSTFLEKNMYTMKETCTLTGMKYETLKFYCNQGLVPNVKRDGGNRRVFDERDIAWINSLVCLKNCGLSIAEMREYIGLCLKGPSSIPERKRFLDGKRQMLLEKEADLRAALQYIDWKQEFYDEVLSGKRAYVSNLIPPENAM